MGPPSLAGPWRAASQVDLGMAAGFCQRLAPAIRLFHSPPPKAFAQGFARPHDEDTPK
jgi:hypothetical protein